MLGHSPRFQYWTWHMRFYWTLYRKKCDTYHWSQSNPYIRKTFPSLFENVLSGSMKSFLQLDHLFEIGLYLLEATIRCHSKKLHGLKPLLVPLAFWLQGLLRAGHTTPQILSLEYDMDAYMATTFGRGLTFVLSVGSRKKLGPIHKTSPTDIFS